MRSFLAAACAAALATFPGGTTGLLPAWAHEAQCPFCRLDVVQDTPEQDNEVVLRYGKKRIEYRCVYCALAHARTEFTGDLIILAPSEIKGKPVVLSRKEGRWAVMPETALFLAAKAEHRQCAVAYRAFTGRAGFEAYLKRHAALLGEAKPLSLAQMVEAAKEPLPAAKEAP